MKQTKIICKIQLFSEKPKEGPVWKLSGTETFGSRIDSVGAFYEFANLWHEPNESPQNWFSNQ